MRSSVIKKSNVRQSNPHRSRQSTYRHLSLQEQMQNDPVYTEEPIYCQHCNKETHSIMSKQPGNKAWFFCAVFSLLGGLCLLPFLCDMCLDVEVACIDCGKLKRVAPAEWFR